MTTQPPRRGSPLPIATQRVAWGLVGLQVLLLLALLLPLPGGLWPAPAWLLVLGAIACLTGLAIALAAMRGLGAGLTASPLPNDAARLRTTGIFAYARHPIYSALMLIGLGLTLPSGSAVKVGILIGLIVLLNVKARVGPVVTLGNAPEQVRVVTIFVD